MKILYITSSLEPKDGWGRYSSGIINEISKNNTVLVACFEPYKESKVSQNKILHSAHSIVSPFKIFSSCLRVQKIINSFRPDAVHFIAEPYVMILPFLRISPSTKVFLTAHGTYSFIPSIFVRERIKNFISGVLIKKAYKKLNAIISVSFFTKQYLLRQYKDFYGVEFDQSKIVVVANGIDLENFSHELTETKDTSIKSILFVGAIKNRKGVLESLQAIKKYKDKYGSDFVYNIAGPYKDNDIYLKQVTHKISELGLEKEVKVLGKVTESQLKYLYANSDLFLMLPIQDGFSVEGFGLVYLEANAYGVPTIGSLNSGAVDAIFEGVSGYVVDPFKAEDVAERIHSIIDNKAIKVEDCKNWAEKHDIRSQAKLINDYYGVK
ncbi:MAG: glycosyltransferase family 4 protein [Patescibacteria group bacterium]